MDRVSEPKNGWTLKHKDATRFAREEDAAAALAGPQEKEQEKPMIEQEMGEMHWSNGWMFKRLENGAVRIRKQISDPDGGEPIEVTAEIPAAEWVSLIHHLGSQQTAEAFQVARELHGDF
jgi:hypothetical protein